VQVDAGEGGPTFVTLAEGAKVVLAADGVVVATDVAAGGLPGAKVLQDGSGVIVVTRADGSSLQLHPTGVLIERSADGVSTRQMNPDDVVITKGADGSVEQREQDGTVIRRTRTGSVTQMEKEPVESVFEWSVRGRQQLKPFICDVGQIANHHVLIKVSEGVAGVAVA
jgi:hypothetical protein